MTNEPDVTVHRPCTYVGEYELLRRLGAGGFGTVFEARHRDTQLPYAVKRMQLSEADAERFRKEALYPARIASRSIHVLSVHSFFRDPADDFCYLVTELVPHGDLRRFLDTQPKPLPLRQSLEIALGISKGLAAIHDQSIVHRDLKPGNILMDRKDDQWVPKIADFGLARSTGSLSVGAFGSAGYAAPEQFDAFADESPGAESDLFSFGMMLYELLTGRNPANATDVEAYRCWIRARRPPVPPSERRSELATWAQLDDLVLNLLEFDRTLRTRSAADAVRTLTEVLRQIERDSPGAATIPPPTGAADDAEFRQPQRNPSGRNGGGTSVRLNATSGRWRLVIAIVLSFVVLFIWQLAFTDDEAGRADESAELSLSQPRTDGVPDSSSRSPGDTSTPPLDAQVVRRLTDAINRDPTNAEAHVQLGNAYFDADHFREAAIAYEKALTLAPSNVNARTDLGVSYYHVNEVDRALQQLDKSLALDPRHTKALLNRGIVKAFGKKDVTGASEDWRRVVALSPGSPEAVAAQRGLDALSAGR